MNPQQSKNRRFNMSTNKISNDTFRKQINENYFKPLYEAGLAYQIQDDLSDFLGIKDRGLPVEILKKEK